MADHVLGRDDRGSLVRASPGDRVIVLLEENPTTGYLWQVSRPEPVLDEPETEFEPRSEGGIGAGGYRWLTFPVTEAGSGELQLELRQPWASPDEAADHWSASIEVS